MFIVFCFFFFFFSSRRRHTRLFRVTGVQTCALPISSVFGNGAIRYCRWDADLAVARMLAYVRPMQNPPVIAFDEYHHGYGVHGGSLRAATIYLGRTSSGHFVVQALAAGLLLLLAKAPRPLPPRDVAHIPRRSPIE